MKRVGILYHPKVQRSEEFAHKVDDFLVAKGIDCWLHSSWDESGAQQRLTDTDLMISIGGDGTILRVARIIYPREIPIVGINFGNLGFMAEFESDEAFEKLTIVLDGGGWVDERSMLEARICSTGKSFHALNDVVVGRGKYLRLINIDVSINQDRFTTYRADAVIISTPTGSTGYMLAANGPILYPESRDMVIKAVCPHLNMDKALILPGDVRVRLKVSTNHEAIISMDGQVEESLVSGDSIEVWRSRHVTRFVRLNPPGTFYKTLVSKLRGKNL